MAKALVYGEVVERDPVDPGYGVGHPKPPHISLPPTPPDVVYPLPPGIDNSLPENPDWPVVIPQPPEKPQPGPPPVAGVGPIEPAPPGIIWPPPNLPIGGKSWVLIAIIGSGGNRKYWLKVDPAVVWPPMTPPASPK